MNKIIFCTLMMLVYLLASCQSGLSGGDFEIKTRQDSLSYAYGVSAITGGAQAMKSLGITMNIDEYKKGYEFAQAQGKDYDSTPNMKALSDLSRELQMRQGKPFTDADMPTTNIDSFSYAYGIYNSSTYVSCDFEVNIDATCAGMADAYAGSAKLGDDQALQLAQAFNQELSMAMQAEAGKAAEKNLAEGKAFLEENKTKDGVITTASGLQYKVLKKGTGTVYPKATDRVSVNYAGRLIDGTHFDGDMDGAPITHNVNGFVDGWIEALQLMQVGDRFELYVPSELAIDMIRIRPMDILLLFIMCTSIRLYH